MNIKDISKIKAADLTPEEQAQITERAQQTRHLHEVQADGTIQAYDDTDLDAIRSLGGLSKDRTDNADQLLNSVKLSDINESLTAPVKNIISTTNEITKGERRGLFRRKADKYVMAFKQKSMALTPLLEKSRNDMNAKLGEVTQAVGTLDSSAIRDQEETKQVMATVKYLTLLEDRVSSQNFEDAEDIQSRDNYLSEISSRKHDLLVRYDTLRQRVVKSRALAQAAKRLSVNMSNAATNLIDEIKDQLVFDLQSQSIAQGQKMVDQLNESYKMIRAKSNESFCRLTDRIAESQRPLLTFDDLQREKAQLKKHLDNYDNKIKKYQELTKEDNRRFISENMEEFNKANAIEVV